MNEKEIERLLAEKQAEPARENVSLLLSPDITRNAMRLRKKKQDRRQTILCAAAGLLFLMLAAGLILYLNTAENPERILHPALMAAAGGMLATLLISPAIAWFSDEEARNET